MFPHLRQHRLSRSVHEIADVLASINPATGETLKQFGALGPAQIEVKLAKAAHAFERHRRTPFALRAERMMAAAQLLDQDKERLARIITLEMGKLLRAGIEEVTKCVRGCRFYAENAERFLADQTIPTDARGARYHALEFSVVAGVPFRGPSAHGGQRGPSQARRERSAMRAGD
jgi:succinate-semialdehyde dehydrogenase/glutarate-semialdehyde dehydrogenase